MKTENLWQNFLNEVQERVSLNSFAIWFNDLVLIKLDSDKVIIQVPMTTHKTMLNSTYYALIEEIFHTLTGKKYSFEFLLPEEVKVVDNLQEVVNKPEAIEEEWESNLNPNLNFDNFVVGNTNRLAYVSARAVAEAPGQIHNPLFLYGKSGLGKTHLMHAIGNYIEENTNKKVLYVTSEEFMTDFTGIADINKSVNSIDYANQFKNKYRNVDILIIDDIQYLVGAEKTQQEFFHTFNSLHKTGKQIIISSDRSPDDLKKLEERLRSRFMWGLPVDIYPPDFDLRCRIIKLKIKNTTIANMMTEEVIEYIANSCQNDVRHIEGTINRLMAYTAMIVPEKIDLEFACEALRDYVNTNIYTVSNVNNIQRVVAEHFGITVEDLKGKKRSNKIAFPRQLAMYICRMETSETFPKIGLEFGGRDHSTVIFACDKIEKEIKSDENLQNIIKVIKSKL